MLIRVVQNREASMTERSATQHSLWSRKNGQSRSPVTSVTTGGLTADILQSHDRSMKGGKKGIDRSDNDIRESLADGTLVARDRAGTGGPRHGGNAGLSPGGATAVPGRSPGKPPMAKAGKAAGESMNKTAAAGAAEPSPKGSSGTTTTNTNTRGRGDQGDRGGRAGRGDRAARASTKSKAKQTPPRATRGTKTGTTNGRPALAGLSRGYSNASKASVGSGSSGAEAGAQAPTTTCKGHCTVTLDSPHSLFARGTGMAPLLPGHRCAC